MLHLVQLLDLLQVFRVDGAPLPCGTVNILDIWRGGAFKTLSVKTLLIMRFQLKLIAFWGFECQSKFYTGMD